MIMRSPRVSVVIPTHDRPQMVREAIESVRAQSYDRIEIVVVDDGSPTPIAPLLEGTDESLAVIRHEDNRGANAARNTGIRESTGEVLAFLDDDDRWESHKVERQVAAFESDRPVPGVVIVGQRFVNDAGETTSIKRPDLNGIVTEELFGGGTAGGFSAIAVRRAVLDESGLPDASFPSLQDREWLIRLSKHCRFHSIEEPLVIRRMGSHAQIADRYVEKRDQTYHRMLEVHGEEARSRGLHGAFRASLARSVAASAVEAGAYDDARRFALRALRDNPTDPYPVFVLLATIGGSTTYRPLKRLKRQVGHHRQGTGNR